jgi:hypothetical protein
MAWVETGITIFIVTFLILLVWSRVQSQSMLDTVKEIIEIFKTIGGKA